MRSSNSGDTAASTCDSGLSSGAPHATVLTTTQKSVTASTVIRWLRSWPSLDLARFSIDTIRHTALPQLTSRDDPEMAGGTHDMA